MGLQQPPLDLTPAAFRLPLHGRQGPWATFLTHEPGRQGVKLLAGLDQIPDRRQSRDSRQGHGNRSTHDGLLREKDLSSTHPCAKLAREEPVSVANFRPELCNIKRSRTDEK
jgi:hypothetical protein